MSLLHQSKNATSKKTQRNNGWEMSKCIAMAILVSMTIACGGPSPSSPLPTHTAESISFTDLDSSYTAGGPVTIQAAADESDITFYTIYWGDSRACGRIDSPLAQLIRVNQSTYQWDMPSGTVVPANAEKLLVFTKNIGGEMESCVSTPIDNDTPPPALPTHKAADVTFTDIDDQLTIGGTVSIAKASDESDVTHYVLRWGMADQCNLFGDPITTIPKTGSNLTYTIPSGTTIPPSVEYLLVYTQNTSGEMVDCDNTSVLIENYEATDPSAPTVAPTAVSFTDVDLDTGQIGGTLTIHKAVPETDITEYVLRWGNGSGCNIASGSYAGTYPVTGSNIVIPVALNTAIPAGATQILAYSANAFGEMEDCNNAAISDIDATLKPWVRIEHNESGDCLEVDNAFTIVDSCNNNIKQQFQLFADGPTYTIVNYLGQCMYDDTPDFQWRTCTGANNEKFTIEKGGADDEWEVKPITRNVCMYQWNWWNSGDVGGTSGNCGVLPESYHWWGFKVQGTGGWQYPQNIAN